MVTELLTLVNVRDVYLDDWRLQRTDAVVQSYGSMGVGTCIQHNAIIGEAYLLHLIDEFALHIALEILDSDFRILGL